MPSHEFLQVAQRNNWCVAAFAAFLSRVSTGANPAARAFGEQVAGKVRWPGFVQSQFAQHDMVNVGG